MATCGSPSFFLVLAEGHNATLGGCTSVGMLSSFWASPEGCQQVSGSLSLGASCFGELHSMLVSPGDLWEPEPCSACLLGGWEGRQPCPRADAGRPDTATRACITQACGLGRKHNVFFFLWFHPSFSSLMCAGNLELLLWILKCLLYRQFEILSSFQYFCFQP